MRTQFAMDLRTERRKSGFSQADIAHLLSSRQNSICELEKGARRPQLEQIIDLSLIYARSFESFFGTMMSERQTAIYQQLRTLPHPATETPAQFNRASSLKRLEKRLIEALSHGA